MTNDKKNKKRFYAAIAERLKLGNPPEFITYVFYRRNTETDSVYVREPVTPKQKAYVLRTLEKRCSHGYIKCPYLH